MPYKSDAQRKFFNANAGTKGLTKDVVNEFNEASKGKKLPEHVNKRHNHKAAMKRKMENKWK